MAEPVLRLERVSRTYNAGRPNALPVLRDVDLALKPGELVALTAPSGAGKSTLLHICGLLDRPDAGEVIIDGARADSLSDTARTALRRERLGFVYQFHHLLPEFSALENIVLPQLMAGRAKNAAVARAKDLLDRVALSQRADHRPATLSGGEAQRVAICRALANGPSVLLADEPTGNLDPGTAGTVFGALLELVRDTGLSALVATHNPDLAAQMDRQLRLEAGGLVAVAPQGSARAGEAALGQGAGDL